MRCSIASFHSCENVAGGGGRTAKLGIELGATSVGTRSVPTPLGYEYELTEAMQEPDDAECERDKVHEEESGRLPVASGREEFGARLAEVVAVHCR